MKKTAFSLNLQELFFFFLLILVTIGFFSVVKPFLVDVFMAIILTILFKKPFAFFTAKFNGKKSKASALTLVLVVFIIIIPLSFIGIMLTKEVGQGYDLFKNNWVDIKIYIEHIPERLSENPVIKNAIDDLDWNKIAENANKTFAIIAQFMLELIQRTFINVGLMIVHFFIVLFLMYYLLIDGHLLVERVQYLIPLKDSDEKELYAKLEKVTDAIVFNTLMIGFIEGAYGGILFAVLGLPSPFFWGMMMTFLSIIPIVGANSIMVPMALYQILIGNVASGIIILIVGAGAIIINQNIVRPRLDGNKSGMHPAIMFLSSMGGLVLFGVIGFIAGPLITGLFLVMWDLFGEKYKQNLENYNKESAPKSQKF